MNILSARYFFCLLFFGLLTAFQPLYGGGITVGGTRLVYNASQREATLPVRNSADSTPHLIQSWIDDFSDRDVAVPFIVTPPLFRLDPGKENILRVVYTGSDLPQDRESVFWLNVKAIPAIEKKTDTNRLVIAVKTRIKLFYRPSTLHGEAVNDAWKKLTFARKGGQIIIQNPTPYHISLFSLKVGNQNIKTPPMLVPFGNASVSDNRGDRVTWQAITDYGAITPELTAGLTEKTDPAPVAGQSRAQP